MYKRLLLCKELLSDKGIIFISIDENEFAQLKIICDEIFKENQTFKNTTSLINFSNVFLH